MEYEATHHTHKEIQEQRGPYAEAMQPADEEEDLEASLVSR